MLSVSVRGDGEGVSRHGPHEEDGQALQGDHEAHRVEHVEGGDHEDPARQWGGGEASNTQTWVGE